MHDDRKCESVAESARGRKISPAQSFTLLAALTHRFAATLIISAALLLAGAPVLAQANAAQNPKALVERASRNELAASNGHTFRYVLHKVDNSKETTKEIVETKDGDVARLIRADGKPLDADREKQELDRLNNLMAHPDLQAHRHKKEQEDSDRASKMVRLLPEAFLYKYEGMVNGPSGPCYRLSFKPDPNFHPPDREAEVYHGMVGELWIDQKQERLAKLDAHLIDDVNFGWGILGKLYKGGSILVEQADVGERHWETTHMRLNLDGKAVMFYSLHFHTTEDATGFQPVPPEMGYQQAIKMLEATPGGGEATATAH